jgi:hypothetical protein
VRRADERSYNGNGVGNNLKGIGLLAIFLLAGFVMTTLLLVGIVAAYLTLFGPP